MDEQTDMEIHLCVLQNIGCLGPLPKKHLNRWFPHFLTCAHKRTDGPADGQTDGQTDGRVQSFMSATKNKITELSNINSCNFIFHFPYLQCQETSETKSKNPINMAKIQLTKTEFFPLIVIIFVVTYLILCWLLAQFVSWTGVILLFVAFYWICSSKFVTIFAKRNAAVTLLN